MKKILLTFLILAFTYNVYGNVRDIQDNHQVIYHIIDGDGNPVGSETVALAIMKISNSQWYDFNDNTFKASGWTSKTVNLTEDSTNGFYYYTFNPPASETTAEEYVFLADNASATYGDHQSELVSYQDIGTSILIASDNIGINWADVSNPTTAVNLSGTNIKTDQVVASVSGAVGSVTGGVTVTINNDKTGYSLSQSFPTNFADMAITSSTGMVTVGTNNDKTGYTVSTVSDKTGYALADSTSDTVIADAVWNAAVATYGTADTYGALVETNLDATVSSRGTSTLTASDNIGINWADVDAPTTTLNLSGTTISTSQVVASVSGAVGSVSGGVTVTTNNDKTGYSLSAAGIDSIWDELQSGHTTAGTFGKYLDTEVSSGGDSAATIWAYGTRILTALDEDDTTIDLDGTTVGGLTTWDKTGYTLSGVGIDSIWDELQAGHTTVGSFGVNLDATVSTRAQPSDVQIFVGQ